MNSRKAGRMAESVATLYLMLKLYRIEERNFATHTGEIDIIARKGGAYIFVEVKYRRDLSKGYPSEAVNDNKQYKIRRTAQYYLMRHNVPIDSTDIRFDVIEILGRKIRHIKAAF